MVSSARLKGAWRRAEDAVQDFERVNARRETLVKAYELAKLARDPKPEHLAELREIGLQVTDEATEAALAIGQRVHEYRTLLRKAEQNTKDEKEAA